MGSGRCWRACFRLEGRCGAGCVVIAARFWGVAHRQFGGGVVWSVRVLWAGVDGVGTPPRLGAGRRAGGVHRALRARAGEHDALDWDVGAGSAVRRRSRARRVLTPRNVVCRGVGGVPLCGVSSVGRWFRGWLGAVEGVVADHGMQGQDAAVGQGEDGLVMAFALVAFALVVGPGDGVGAQ